ncbi:glycoside hydrolase family 5 protein [Aulographum hederae CBS 113979]|uniref:mannan endo-1,4-beta-mannosidase n=1 Tax=Aulographum hederae CBS 113979 TaxID=1176131 RepID=A0A6G1H7J3_9PEZI|nr:glycoside hydrolase family 5 protein [Aulographum hederae CBS 113979]
MKFNQFLPLVAALVLGSSCAPLEGVHLPIAQQAGSQLHKRFDNSTASFAKTANLQFDIDGASKYYPGTNSYWISFMTNDADVDSTFATLQENGLKILRIWGFNDVNEKPQEGTVYFQSFAGSEPVINTGADGLERLDYVVKSAEKHGIKLIINFVNNWTDYGGMAAYMKFFGGAQSADASNNSAWYTSTEAQAQYKKYIEAVVSRFKTSPTVLAWELANEPRCKGCDTSVIFNWASETSKYVKSLDPNHLVTLGDEGFGLEGDGSYPYTYGEGVDFVKNLGIKELDFGTFHLYPKSWGVSNDWGNGWVESHGAACAAAGKPCLFEEYGTETDHCTVEQPWQKTAINTKAIAGDLFWQLGVDTSTGKTHDDGNTIYTNSEDWKCLVDNHGEAIAQRNGA